MATNAKLPATVEEQEKAAQAAEAQAPEPKEYDELHTELGDTTIADNVVQKIAGIAAREIPGVYAMGNAARRAISNLAQRIPGGQTDVTGGVAVKTGEREAAIDVSVVVEYGARIVEVSDAIRSNVIRAVEEGTGLSVVAVDIAITDVHLPEEDDQSAPVPSSPELR